MRPNKSICISCVNDIFSNEGIGRIKAMDMINRGECILGHTKPDEVPKFCGYKLELTVAENEP